VRVVAEAGAAPAPASLVLFLVFIVLCWWLGQEEHFLQSFVRSSLPW